MRRKRSFRSDRSSPVRDRTAVVWAVERDGFSARITAIRSDPPEFLVTVHDPSGEMFYRLTLKPAPAPEEDGVRPVDGEDGGG